MAKESWFLILTAIGVALVSLGYGVNPKLGMPLLYGIDIESVNQINMYRAIMGLYLAISLYWIIGALNENVKLSALWSMFVFMTGIGSGRLTSVYLDGTPSTIFMFFLFIEIISAVLCLFFIFRLNKGIEA
jgi:hypothetical protein